MTKEEKEELERVQDAIAECEWHNFKPIDGSLLYECENCGCKMSAAFVAGYERGIKHGFNRANTGVFPQEDIGHDE